MSSRFLVTALARRVWGRHVEQTEHPGVIPKDGITTITSPEYEAPSPHPPMIDIPPDAYWYYIRGSVYQRGGGLLLWEELYHHAFIMVTRFRHSGESSPLTIIVGPYYLYDAHRQSSHHAFVDGGRFA